MSQPDCTIAQSVAKKIVERSRTGYKKYGVTLDRDDLTHREWLVHHQEELLDAANYVEKQIQILDSQTKQSDEKTEV